VENGSNSEEEPPSFPADAARFARR